MVKILGFIIIGVIISALEVPKMRRQNLNKEIILYIFLLVTGLGLLSLLSLGINVTSPSIIIEKIFSPLNSLLSRIL